MPEPLRSRGMGFELGWDLITAAKLAKQLRRSEGASVPSSKQHQCNRSRRQPRKNCTDERASISCIRIQGEELADRSVDELIPTAIANAWTASACLCRVRAHVRWVPARPSQALTERGSGRSEEPEPMKRHEDRSFWPRSSISAFAARAAGRGSTAQWAAVTRPMLGRPAPSRTN